MKKLSNFKILEQIQKVENCIILFAIVAVAVVFIVMD